MVEESTSTRRNPVLWFHFSSTTILLYRSTRLNTCEYVWHSCCRLRQS